MTHRARYPFVPLAFGRYPTAVELLPSLSNAASELWVKRDDLTHDVYGGNKVRKLEWLIAEAKARGARRVVTVGAAGSHHVLATTYFGQQNGLDVEAVLVPQPTTQHVREILRADVALGLRVFPVRSWAAAPLAVLRRVAHGARFITVGGSSVVGSMGYVAAGRELAAQVRAGALPEPDVCVVALGSGGTAGGLAAAFEIEGLRTRVVGVCVSEPPWILRLAALRLGRACSRRSGLHATMASMRARFSMDVRFLGAGYGHPTAEGEEATLLAREHAGVTLDPTYTAKTFAAALWHVRAHRAPRVLYWHTLSGAPIDRVLAAAKLSEHQIDERLRALALA